MGRAYFSRVELEPLHSEMLGEICGLGQPWEALLISMLASTGKRLDGTDSLSRRVDPEGLAETFTQRRCRFGSTRLDGGDVVYAKVQTISGIVSI